MFEVRSESEIDSTLLYDVVVAVEVPRAVVVPYSTCARVGLSVDHEMRAEERVIEDVAISEMIGSVVSFTLGVMVVKVYLQ